MRVEGAGGILPRVKLWAGGLPEPAAAVIEEGAEPAAEDRTATAIVNLCRQPQCGPAQLRMRSSQAAVLEAHLIGYFRPLSATDRIGGGPIFPLATEGLDNNFFGTNAGASITTGIDNAFFGGDAGTANTERNSNAFFGRRAGQNNTSGRSNSFFGTAAGVLNAFGNNNSYFGRSAGVSNTTEDNNTFIGAFSNGVAGITNATAVG